MRKTIIALVIATSASGCASIMNGSTHNVAIQSTPDNAKVVIKDTDGIHVFEGNTPTKVSLQKSAGYFKKREYLLEISKEGYQKQVINLTASASGWYVAGNLLFGGLIGWLVVDPVSGGMWTLNTESVNANLQSTKVSNSGMSLNVAMMEDLSEKERKKLIKLN